MLQRRETQGERRGFNGIDARCKTERRCKSKRVEEGLMDRCLRRCRRWCCLMLMLNAAAQCCCGHSMLRSNAATNTAMSPAANAVATTGAVTAAASVGAVRCFHGGFNGVMV